MHICIRYKRCTLPSHTLHATFFIACTFRHKLNVDFCYIEWWIVIFPSPHDQKFLMCWCERVTRWYFLSQSEAVVGQERRSSRILAGESSVSISDSANFLNYLFRWSFICSVDNFHSFIKFPEADETIMNSQSLMKYILHPQFYRI